MKESKGRARKQRKKKSTHQLLTHSPSPPRDGEENWKSKTEKKLVGRDKDSLIDEGNKSKKTA